MESTWSELFLTWFKDFAGEHYPYLILFILLAPLSPYIYKSVKKIPPTITKFGRLLDSPASLDAIRQDIKLFNGKITAILSFIGEALKGVAFFECDIDGKCIMTTRYWTTITGLTMDESIGFGWVSALSDEDRDRVVESWLDAVEQKREWRCEFSIVHRATRVKTKIVGISLVIKDGLGNPIRFMRMFTQS